jgi:hypothetical protein
MIYTIFLFNNVDVVVLIFFIFLFFYFLTMTNSRGESNCLDNEIKI